MQRERLWTKNFILLCIMNFFLACSFFFYMPTLPLFVVEELGGMEDQVGLIAGIFTVSSLLIRPWSGMLVDQLGRRRILIISLILYIVVLSGYLIAYAFWILWMVRLLHGGTFGLTTTTVSTIAADEVPESRRGEGLGYFGTIMTLAMTIGPAIGLMIVNNWSFQVMFSVAVLIFLVSLVLSRWIKFEEEPVRRPIDLRISVRDWKALYEPRVFPIAVAMIALAFVFGGIMSFIPLYAAEIGEDSLGGMYFTIYALALVLSRPISGRLYDRMGPDVVIYPGMLLYLIGTILLGLAQGAFLLLVAAFIIGLGYGGIQPSLQARSIDLVEPNRRGAATATFFSGIDLGIGLGAIVLGYVVKYLGYQNMFLLSGFFVVLSAWLYYRSRVKESAAPNGVEPKRHVHDSSV